MRGRRAVVVVLAAALALAGCSGKAPAEDGRLKVVATTPIIADVARQVAGPDGDVTSIVPPGADPHSYEPSLRDSRDLAYADVALSNHLLLEEQRIMRSVAATLPADSSHVELSEESERHGADLLPVVEDQALDQLWLGARVTGRGAPAGQPAPESVTLRLESAEGPGDAFGYVTQTFGRVERVFDSTRPGQGGMDLPPRSHTHLSWAFTRPGEYTLRFAGYSGDRRIAPAAPVRFVVGQDAGSSPSAKGRTVLDAGHADITLDLDRGAVAVSAEATGQQSARGGADGQRGGGRRQALERHEAESVVVAVGSKALTTVPSGQSYRFLGRPDSEVYILPQAVLGKHVHGSIDPHVWLDPSNVKAWTVRIRDAFIAKDPEHAEGYRARAAAYTRTVDALDEELRGKLRRIPPERRHLVTTHDAFAYFARAYGLKTAGFAVPATGAEPGPRERARLAAAIRDLRVRAVFAQPRDGAPGQALRQAAGEQGVQVCELRSDTLDDAVPTYEALLRTNAEEVLRCLG